MVKLGIKEEARKILHPGRDIDEFENPMQLVSPDRNFHAVLWAIFFIIVVMVIFSTPFNESSSNRVSGESEEAKSEEANCISFCEENNWDFKYANSFGETSYCHCSNNGLIKSFHYVPKLDGWREELG